VRPLQNAPFCSISASGSNFNPRNTKCIPVVKIIAFLELKQKLTFFKGLIVIFRFIDLLPGWMLQKRDLNLKKYPG
jgi:hypothetical protein